MARSKRPTDAPSDPWKNKMGVQFSGLETTRDRLVALGIGVAFVVIAIVIAFVAFG